MGDPTMAAVFKALIDHFTAVAHSFEDKIEKLKKELKAKEKEIQEAPIKLHDEMDKMLLEGEDGAEKLGESIVKYIEELGERIKEIKKKLEDLQKVLDEIYKQIGIYAIEYFKFAN